MDSKKIIDGLEDWGNDTQKIISNLFTFVEETSKDLNPKDKEMIDKEMKKLEDLKDILGDLTSNLKI